MKKFVFTILLATLCLIEAVYIFLSFNRPSADEVNPIVAFTDRLEVTVDERSFVSEDAPENQAEETILRLYLADFLNDHQLREDSMAQNGIFEIELKNKQKEDLEKEHIVKTCVLHDIETVSIDADTQNTIEDRLDLEVIQEFKLTAYEIVKLQWTEEREQPVNYGNGFHERYFICGTTQKDSEWRIYGVGLM